MHAVLRTLALLALLAFAACGGGRGAPSEVDARAYLASRVDDGRTDRVQLSSFSKTDGVVGEVNGVKTYAMNFTATAQVQQEAYVMLQSPFGDLEQLPVLELPQSDGFIPMMRPPEFDYAKKLPSGAEVQMAGRMLFERHESGWVPVGLQMRASN